MLLLLLVLRLHLNLLVNVGGDLLGGGLLNDDGFEAFGGRAIAGDHIARDVAIAVDANHRLHDVLHLITGYHGHGNGNAYKFPKIMFMFVC